MYTIRPTARPACAATSPANSNRAAEASLVSTWDEDIVCASRAAARRRGFTGNHPFAADVAQNARVALLVASREKGVTAEPYLRRVVSNSIKNSSRQTKVTANSVPDDVLQEVAANAQAGDFLAERHVRDWVDSQPPQHKAVFDLLYREDLTQREAAARLGVSQPRIAKLHRQLIKRGAQGLHDLAA